MRTSKDRFAPWLIFLFVLPVYLAFPTRMYYWDGIQFAQRIEDSTTLSPSLVHPNHPIYNVVGYLIYKAALGLGAHVRAIGVLQTMNSILSVLCVLVLFHILRVSLRSNYFAIVLALLLSFSSTWWKFSTDANAYIPSILFLLISFYFVLPLHRPRPLIVALSHSVSMCFHQLAVFFFPVAILGILLQASSQTVRRRLWLIGQYGGVVFSATIVGYYFCFFHQKGKALHLSAFIDWLTSYSPKAGFTFNFWDNLTDTLRGHVRLFWGGRLNSLEEGTNPLIVALIGILILICLTSIFKLARDPKGSAPAPEKTISANHRNWFKLIALLCAVWSFPFFIFLFFWAPRNTFYRLFYFPALIILLGVMISAFDRSERHQWQGRTALLVGSMVISNFLFLIYPYSNIRRDTPLAVAVELNGVWSTQTVVYYAHFSADDALLKYFNPSTTWEPLGSVISEEFQSELRDVYGRGAAAWIETTAIDRITNIPEEAQWLAAHTRGQPTYSITNSAYRVKVTRIVP